MKKYKFEVINLTNKKKQTIEFEKEFCVYDRKTNSYVVINCGSSNYDSSNDSQQTK